MVAEGANGWTTPRLVALNDQGRGSIDVIHQVGGDGKLQLTVTSETPGDVRTIMVKFVGQEQIYPSLELVEEPLQYELRSTGDVRIIIELDVLEAEFAEFGEFYVDQVIALIEQEAECTLRLRVLEQIPTLTAPNFVLEERSITALDMVEECFEVEAANDRSSLQLVFKPDVLPALDTLDTVVGIETPSKNTLLAYIENMNFRLVLPWNGRIITTGFGPSDTAKFSGNLNLTEYDTEACGDAVPTSFRYAEGDDKHWELLGDCMESLEFSILHHFIGIELIHLSRRGLKLPRSFCVKIASSKYPCALDDVKRNGCWNMETMPRNSLVSIGNGWRFVRLCAPWIVRPTTRHLDGKEIREKDIDQRCGTISSVEGKERPPMV